MATLEGGQVEVLVVDNCSSDGSLDYLSSRFSFARFIANAENLGFAKANNQALQLATGNYVLFLNPDTIVPEDAFSGCMAFMASHADAGACGVRMIDGSGKFLPESKRGFPSPWVSFCKMSGLTALFPRSRRLARYYLGHLSASSTHEVDALSGAYMLARKEVLDRTGGFDERFFMYAEDIDLSYRIQQAGYRNYYFAGCTIIHFKGESTRRDMRYVKLFHKAMVQFVQKHYRGKASLLYVELLKSAIWLRGMLAAGAPSLSKQAHATFKTLVTGDMGEAKKIMAPLNRANRQAVTSIDEANEIIWCEGPACTFKDIIASLPQYTQLQRIHAAGSGSSVGSHSKKEMGDVIVI